MTKVPGSQAGTEAAEEAAPGKHDGPPGAVHREPRARPAASTVAGGDAVARAANAGLRAVARRPAGCGCPKPALFADTGGTRNAFFNEAQLRSVLVCLQPPLGPPSEDAAAAQVLTATAALQAFRSGDAIEGMLAAQAVAAHNAAMECLRRACEPGQSAEVASRLRRDGAAMSRTFVHLLAGLDRRRGKTARQVVRVERVTVEAGAQAIVGAVGPAAAPGRGGG